MKTVPLSLFELDSGFHNVASQCEIQAGCTANWPIGRNMSGEHTIAVCFGPSVLEIVDNRPTGAFQQRQFQFLTIFCGGDTDFMALPIYYPSVLAGVYPLREIRFELLAA